MPFQCRDVLCELGIMKFHVVGIFFNKKGPGQQDKCGKFEHWDGHAVKPGSTKEVPSWTNWDFEGMP